MDDMLYILNRCRNVRYEPPKTFKTRMIFWNTSNLEAIRSEFGDLGTFDTTEDNLLVFKPHNSRYTLIVDEDGHINCEECDTSVNYSVFVMKKEK